MALLGALSLGWGLASTPLFDPDEPVYAQAGREMLQRGSWLVPYFDGRPWFDKPFLFYTLEAASQRLLGMNSLAARLPSVLCAALLAWLVSVAARRWQPGPGASRWAPLVALTALYPAVVARAAVTDTLFVLALAAAWVGMGEVLRDADARGAGATAPGVNETYRGTRAAARGAGGVVLGAVGLGAAIVTKGPAALVLLGLQFLLYGALTQSARPLARLKPWLIFTLGAALAAPWYVLMLARFPGAFASDFLGRQNVSRFLVPEHPGRGPLYFAIMLPVVFLPWTLFAPLWIRGLRRGPAIAAAVPAGFRPRVFLWSWVAVVVVFFSASATKLPTYILPAVPALSLLVAEALAHSGRRARAWALGTAIACALALAAAASLWAPKLVCYYSAASRAADLERIAPGETLWIYKGGFPGTLYYSGRRGRLAESPEALEQALKIGAGFWVLLRPRHAAELASVLGSLEKIPGPSGPWGEGLLLYHRRASGKAGHTS